jgi:hypothetical protein
MRVSVRHLLPPGENCARNKPADGLLCRLFFQRFHLCQLGACLIVVLFENIQRCERGKQRPLRRRIFHVVISQHRLYVPADLRSQRTECLFRLNQVLHFAVDFVLKNRYVRRADDLLLRALRQQQRRYQHDAGHCGEFLESHKSRSLII